MGQPISFTAMWVTMWLSLTAKTLVMAKDMVQLPPPPPSPPAPSPPPPSPPPPPRPTWRPDTWMGAATAVTTEAGEEDSEWPWWWWIVAVTWSSLIVVVLLSVCVCLCCKHRKRRRPVAEVTEAGGDGSTPRILLRMDSSAAKRYLHSVVSVFSWGSDFEPDGEVASRPLSHVYANPHSLAAAGGGDTAVRAPPPRPARRRQSGPHYLNVPPAVPPR